MILHIYKAEPEYRMNYDYNDIDISKYDFYKTIITNYVDINELIKAIEDREMDLEFEESDLIELAPGSEELNTIHDYDNIGFKTETNFLIVYGLGVKQIAINHKQLNSELGLKRLQNIF